MAYKLSGVILEAIFDDEGRVIRIAPKIGEFKVEKISESEARAGLVNGDECVENGGHGEDECESHEECEELLPPMWPFVRRCVKNFQDKCICQYVFPEQ